MIQSRIQVLLALLHHRVDLNILNAGAMRVVKVSLALILYDFLILNLLLVRIFDYEPQLLPSNRFGRLLFLVSRNRILSAADDDAVVGYPGAASVGADGNELGDLV